MSLEDSDVIRDAGVNQGIGASPLLSQSIQRNNIEDLHSLRANIAESQTTLENQKEEALAKARAEFAKQQAMAVKGGGAASAAPGQFGGVPRYVLQTSSAFRSMTMLDQDGKNALSGAGGAILAGSNAPKFVIQGQNVGGGSSSYQFKDESALQSFLDQNPDLAKSLVGVAGDPLERAISAENINKFAFPRISVDQADKLIGGDGKGRGQFRFGSGGHQKPTGEQAEINKIGTSKSGEIDFTKVSHNTQARIFDSALMHVNTMSKAIPVISSIDEFNNLSPQQQAILAIARSGNLAEKLSGVKSAIKHGLLAIDTRAYRS